MTEPNSTQSSGKGRLLVSTKTAAAGRKTVTLVICIALFLVGIFVMANGEAFYKLSHQHYRLISAALGIFIFAYALYTLILRGLRARRCGNDGNVKKPAQHAHAEV